MLTSGEKSGLALESTGQADQAAGEYRLYLQEDPNGRDAARAKEKLASLNSQSPK